MSGDASPQVENGHVRIAAELCEAIARFAFNGPQLRIIVGVMRDSYGWKRKITLTRTVMEWARFLDMPHSTFHRALAELKTLGVIDVEASGGLVLVKNYNAWGKTPELGLSLTHPNNGMPEPCGQVDNPVDNSASLIGVPVLDHPNNGIPKVGWNPSNNGMPYKESKKEKKGEGQTPPVLSNGKNDTARNRAELGDPERPPEEHPDFGKLGFARRDELTDAWKDAVKKKACRRCQRAPKASEAWPFCRACTKCSECSAKADGVTKFVLVGSAIACSKCAPANVEKPNR